jgi:hypothetical protein
MASQAYLQAVLSEYEEEIAAGFETGLDAKKAMWRCAVTLYFMGGEDEIAKLADIAVASGLQPYGISRTLASARAKAASQRNDSL